MAAEKARRHTLASGVEDDVLQRHGTRLNDVNLASRKAEAASLRRHEAAGWLRKMIGVVRGKDLAVEPSEDEFRIGLRSGIILCNVLNKLQPGAVPRVVEGAGDSDVMADGAALSAYQYFENVRNFLMAVQEMGLHTFEASDLEEGGNCGRIVSCVLALKSYSEWIEGGKHGSWKYGGDARPPASGKPFLRKNSEPCINSLSRTVSSSSATDLSGCGDLGCDYIEGLGSPHSLNSLLREHLSDKKPEEVPIVVESLLSKFMEQLERRMATQQEAMKIGSGDKEELETEDSTQETAAEDKEMEEMEDLRLEQEECDVEKFKFNNEESSRQQLLKQQRLVEKQNREIQEMTNLKLTNVQELKKLIHHTQTGIYSLKQRYCQDLTNLSNHLQGLASAASAYHRVVEENRKFYNQLQDLKGNIRVYCRVRPLLSGQSNQVSTVSNIEEGSVSVNTTPPKKGQKIFSFHRVFGPSATQEEVFSDTQALIRSVLDGYNICIFAYGQTGSGKTYTMSGPDDLKEENEGVNYRALRDLFILSGQRKDTFRYEIAVQMLEIYNDKVRDLLVTDGATTRYPTLEIRKSGQNGTNVPDANLVPVSSTSDVIYLMNMGQKNRAVGAAATNDRSSRSHSCMTVYAEGREVTSGNIVRGCMHLVDLAGSERVDKSEATGDRLKEAQHINKSLSALGDVISSLSRKNSHVPYRNSKLTQLLQHSLGGQAKILLFVHISPEPEALEETISTLKFAERVSTVRMGALRPNKDSTDVRELKEQIASLKAALWRKEKEAEQLRHSQIPRPRSYGSSPKQASWTLGGRTKPGDDHDSCSLEKKATSKLKRRSLDLQEMNMNSNAWPLVGGHRVNGKEEDEVSICGDRVDNLTLKRQDSLSSDDNLVGQWEAESKQFSQISPDRSIKVTLKKEDKRGYGDLQSNLSELVVIDDGDEQEVVTSDSSESDLNWLVDMPKATSMSNGSFSQAKKLSQPIPIKNPQIRNANSSVIPSLIPLPSRKEAVSRLKKRSSPPKAKTRARRV
ncbi:kinesin-like protein KIN-14I [Neltuma alba]|uniref:kinesin-like protein KIN-14I n=1 Tax=Neltuma alba TaxID=207710 RepID=UPI0010A56B5B|nr:kinesin-like protein KIN-14I [Prosopis alba]